MTEVVVPRLADDVAILPVVRVAADQPVLVLQLAVLSVHPAGAGVQALGLGDPVEEGLVGSCNTKLLEKLVTIEVLQLLPRRELVDLAWTGLAWPGLSLSRPTTSLIHNTIGCLTTPATPALPLVNTTSTDYNKLSQRKTGPV